MATKSSLIRQAERNANLIQSQSSKDPHQEYPNYKVREIEWCISYKSEFERIFNENLDYQGGVVNYLHACKVLKCDPIVRTEPTKTENKVPVNLKPAFETGRSTDSDREFNKLLDRYGINFLYAVQGSLERWRDDKNPNTEYNAKLWLFRLSQKMIDLDETEREAHMRTLDLHLDFSHDLEIPVQTVAWN